MALLVKKEVTKAGLSRTGCYIQLVPHFITGSEIVPTDKSIWATKEDYIANPSNGTIPSLDEIASNFSIEYSSAPENCEGDTVAMKMLYWINEEAKKAILTANPSWEDADVEIVDLP